MEEMTKELEQLYWIDFSNVFPSMGLASVSQYSLYGDSVTDYPDFNELAAGYEEDEEWKQIVKNETEYSFCSLLVRFKVTDVCDPEDMASAIVDILMTDDGPLSFIWNAEINLDATYLITNEGYGYFRVDLYSNIEEYPMISNNTLQMVLEANVA